MPAKVISDNTVEGRADEEDRKRENREEQRKDRKTVKVCELERGSWLNGI